MKEGNETFDSVHDGVRSLSKKFDMRSSQENGGLRAPVPLSLRRETNRHQNHKNPLRKQLHDDALAEKIVGGKTGRHREGGGKGNLGSTKEVR